MNPKFKYYIYYIIFRLRMFRIGASVFHLCLTCCKSFRLANNNYLYFMSTRYKFVDNYSTYFVTFAVVNWIDVFTRNDYRAIVIDSINYCVRNKGLIVHGWVLMTNHVHLLISMKNDDTNTLSVENTCR